MKTPFSWKLTACACAVLLAACGGGSGTAKNLTLASGTTSSGGGSVAAVSTAATSTDTAAAVDTTATDTAATTTDTTGTSNTSGTATTTTDNSSNGTSTTTDTAATTEDKTIIKYGDTAFDKSMSFDNEFNWGGVATQQPHLRNTKHVVSGGQLDKVVIDGKEIMLMKAAQTPRLNVWTEGRLNDKGIYEESVWQSSRGGYSYTWFGVVNTNREDIKPEDNVERIDTMIAHGKLTDEKDMPSVGQAKYTGHAIYYGNGTSNRPFDTNKSVGTTQFNVDYAKKTIVGTIKDDAKRIQDIQVEGKITGNSFAGTKTNDYKGVKTDVEVNGRFFGPKAAELGGVFNSKNTDDILGAFGAKKAK